MSRRAALSLVAVVGLGLLVVAGWIGARGDQEPVALQVVLSPHPDDELQGWARIAPTEGLYTVFVLVTRGEASGNCEGMPGLQEELGERRPSPTPAGRGTASCGAARVDSWHAFLDLVADRFALDATDELRTAEVDVPDAPSVEGWVGERSARVVLGLGDGAVQADEVDAAMRHVLDDLPAHVPDLPLERLVATSYSNDAPGVGGNTEGDGDPRALEYEHPDHAAVNDAATQLAELFADGSWIVTHPWAPDAVELEMSRGDYAAMMGMGPRAGDGRQRLGAQQVAYGWLAFPKEYWTRGERAEADSGVLFPRIQYFRHVADGPSTTPTLDP